MVEVSLKPNASRPGWYTTDELFQSKTGQLNSSRAGLRSHVWRPPTDMYETDDAVIVRVEIAGMRENEFSLVMQENVLVIRGSRTDVPERRAYHQMEIRFGEFSSEVELPVSVQVEQASAEYRNGFLTVKLPKSKSQQIQITDL